MVSANDSLPTAAWQFVLHLRVSLDLVRARRMYFVLGCLGTANYWTTIPFLLVMAAFSVFGIVSPGRVTRGKVRAWQYRLLCGCLLVFSLVGVASAVREARERPNCEEVAAVPAPERGP